MKILLTISITIIITTILTIVRIKKPDWSIRLNMIVLITSIVGLSLYTLIFTDIEFENNATGFRPASTGGDGLIFFALPAIIMIGISEIIARKKEQ